MIKVIFLMGVFFSSALAQGGREYKLSVPPELRDAKSVMLRVEVGRIVRGSEIEIYTPGGKLLGVISPFGKLSAGSQGTFLVPIPAAAFADDVLTVRLTVTHGKVRRSPTNAEVPRMRLGAGPLPG